MPPTERIPRTRLCRWCRAKRIPHCAAKEEILTSQLFSLLAADMALLNNPGKIPESLELEKLEAAWPEISKLISDARGRRCHWVK